MKEATGTTTTAKNKKGKKEVEKGIVYRENKGFIRKTYNMWMRSTNSL